MICATSGVCMMRCSIYIYIYIYILLQGEEVSYYSANTEQHAC